MCQISFEMLLPHNFWHMLLPWQQTFRHYWKCVLHIYTSSPTMYTKFIWIAFKMLCFSCFFKYAVTMATNIPPLSKIVSCTSTLQGQHVCQVLFENAPKFDNKFSRLLCKTETLHVSFKVLFHVIDLQYKIKSIYDSPIGCYAIILIHIIVHVLHFKMFKAAFHCLFQM